ncbi:MAG: hypothetical protein HY290_10740, partial [Planctomycetia bacterium]|nr:hypothetical protein [Planctomycetia bacterium]
GRFDWDNHLTLAANPHVQDLMVDEVLVAFEANESGESAPQHEQQFEEGDEGGAGRASMPHDLAPPRR